MCGIVGGIAQRNVVPILLEGLKRLEYRGYDSAGLAVIQNNEIYRKRELGKVKGLEAMLQADPIAGNIGIAHTRWATHGVPSTQNAHPHVCRHKVAVVHNGIIENHEHLRSQQLADGYEFTSQTDTEVIVHQIFDALETADGFVQAVKQSIAKLEGAYALGIMSADHPDTLVACRKGSPLVIGIGIGEHFIASDVAALLPVTQRFIFLEDGDVAVIGINDLVIYDKDDNIAVRPIKESQLTAEAAEKGEYRHYMLKESTNSRTPFHKPWKAALFKTACKTTPSALTPLRFSTTPKRFLSWRAAPATMPAWSPVTGWKSLREYRAASKSPANSGTAIPYSRRIP